MNRSFQPIVFALVLIIGIFLGSFFLPNHNTQKYTKLNAVLELIENNYVDQLTSSEFENKIISSLMKELDPHSSYQTKEDYEINKADMIGSFGGVGIEFRMIKDSLVVLNTTLEGPSRKLGIIPGDRIVEVNNENIAGINIPSNDIIRKLRGKEGSQANIKIKRRGNSKLLSYKIVRDKIPIRSVATSFMITDNIGYIKLIRFSETTKKEFRIAIKKLLNSGMKKLVFDLRGNGGGRLSAAISVCDQFLEPGELITYTEGRKRSRKDYKSSNNPMLKNIECAILINEASASASEIVAGCMQDHDRAVIVGRTSFGKGLVQEPILLKDGSVVTMTTQRYYTPSGRCIQKPYASNNSIDIMENPPNSKKNSIESLKFRTNSGRVVYGGGGITPDVLIENQSVVTSNIFLDILSHEIALEFVFNFTRNYKKKRYLQETSRDKFIKESLSPSIFNLFKEFANRGDNKFDFDNIGIQLEKDLAILIQSNIAKYIWGNDSYFEIESKNDDFIKKSLDVLEKK